MDEETIINGAVYIDIKEISKRVHLPEFWVRGLIGSGLLGYSIDGKFSERNVELFNAYGTQWGDSIGTRNFPEGKLSIVESIGEQPLDTITKVQISIKEQMELHEGFDYIVQFYVKPNMGYFQPSYEPCYINGANITIDKKIRLIFDEKIHCVIYPTPEHKLGLISFYFFKFDVNAERENEKEDFEDIIFRVAKKHLYTIIEYLSFTHDTEIYVATHL